MAARRGSSMSQPTGSNSPEPALARACEGVESLLVVVVVAVEAPAWSSEVSFERHPSASVPLTGSFDPELTLFDVLVVAGRRKLVRVFLDVLAQVLGEQLVPLHLPRFGRAVDGACKRVGVVSRSSVVGESSAGPTLEHALAGPFDLVRGVHQGPTALGVRKDRLAAGQEAVGNDVKVSPELDVRGRPRSPLSGGNTGRPSGALDTPPILASIRLNDRLLALTLGAPKLAAQGSRIAKGSFAVGPRLHLNVFESHGRSV